MRAILLIVAILALALPTSVEAKEAPRCGAWTGTDYELRTRGCVPLIDDTYVVDAQLCPYVAYVLATFNDWLYINARVTTSQAQFRDSVEAYGCTQETNGDWVSIK